ncbi:MAG: glycosyltransferase [Dokdonia sp.]|jgi:GT2 family glycosyltransferase
MTVHIVIVTYNGMSWLPKCLDSIPDGMPTIVVDNASTDQTCSYIQKEHPAVHVLAQKENLGFGRANNLGIQKALDEQTDAVFLLNQDAYLQKNSISEIIKTHQAHPEYGVLSPVHFNGSHTLFDRKFANYMRYDRNKHFVTDAYLGQLKPIYEVPFVNAAAWFIPRSTIEKIGGFDPIFSHYGEDDNYLQRVQYHGLKVGVVAHSTICHDREDRPDTKPDAYTDSYYDHLARKWKIWYANINDDKAIEKMDTLQRKRKKQSVKGGMKGDLKRFLKIKKEVSLLKKTREEIERSRKINKTIGKHYL